MWYMQKPDPSQGALADFPVGCQHLLMTSLFRGKQHLVKKIDLHVCLHILVYESFSANMIISSFPYNNFMFKTWQH